MRRLKRREFQAISLLSPFLALGVWELAVRTLDVSELIVAPPSAVAVKVVQQLTDGLLLTHIRVTVVEIVGGFTVGSLIGVGIAVAVSQSRIAHALLYNIVLSVKSVPKIAVAPLIVLWIGYGYESKVIVASLSAFFPVFVNVTAGLYRSDPDQIRLMRSLTATRWQTFRTVKVPNALPSLFTGLEIAIVLSVVGTVVAEFIGSTEGLGYFIMISHLRVDTAGIFVSLVFLAAIGITLNRIVHAISRRVVFWTTVDSTSNW